MPDSSVSIIIVNWNTRELLRECLEAVSGQIVSMPAGPTWDVFVVDNDSSDGSADMVRRQFPTVRLMQNTENVGFSRANNQAFRRSTAPYILLLNPDTVPQMGALPALVEFMDQHPAVGAAGARLLNSDGTLQVSCAPSPKLVREIWRLFHLDVLWPVATYRMFDWPIDTPRSVEVVQGACMIVRRAALNGVDLLDEDFFIYSEEVDLCERLRHEGWQIYWVPQAAVVHYGGQSTRQVALNMFVRLYGAKVQYFRKHYGWSTARLYKLVLMTAVLARLALIPLAWCEPSPRRHHHLLLARHYWYLLRVLPGL